MQTCLSARLYYALILNARKPFSHLFLQRPVRIHQAAQQHYISFATAVALRPAQHMQAPSHG